MSKNLKIAIYTGIVPTTTFIDRLIKELAHSGHTILLFGLQRGKTKAVKNVHYITYTNRLSKAILLFKYSILLSLFFAKDKKKLDAIIASKNKNKRQLKSKYYPVLYHRPNIFHLQWAKGVSDWQWVQEFGIKLVLSLRGTHITISPIGDESLQYLYQEYVKKVDAFHAVSKSMIPYAEKHGALPQKIKVVKSGFDLKDYSYKRKEKLQSPLSIISVGRSHWVKGYAYSIDAMHELNQKNIPFQYTIIGAANQEELLYKRSYYQLDNLVTFKDKAPYKDVLQAIQEADVLILPSVEEGIANVAIEAMALGTLVIASNCGGMSELINQNNGMLVPNRNAIALAEAISRVQTMTIKEYQALTSEARNIVEKNHDASQMITEMNKFYESVKLDAL